MGEYVNIALVIKDSGSHCYLFVGGSVAGGGGVRCSA